jgi:hypothetical protein
MLKNMVLHSTYIFSMLLVWALLTSCHQTYFFIKSHPVKLILIYKIRISFVYSISNAVLMTFSEMSVQTMDSVMEYRLVEGCFFKYK